MTQQTSLLVERQVPGFVREDHPQFVEFLKAYYKFLEYPTNEYKNIKYITDVDVSIDDYENNFFYTYANLIPKTYKVDNSFLIKNVLPLYLSKGSERSFKFLFRLLFDEEINIRYLRDNILHTSASKWVKENSLNISSYITSKYIGDGTKKEFYLVDFVSQSDIEVYVNDTLVTTGYGLSKSYRKLIFDAAPSSGAVIEVKYKVIDKEIFLSRKVTGLTSGATCIVEKTSFELINNRETLRLYVDNKTVNGTFTIGEKLHIDIFVGSVLVDVILSTISELKSIKINDGGANYNVGDQALITAPGAIRNPVAVVRRVFYPKIESIRIAEGGCGFQPGANITLNGIDFPLVNIKVGNVFAEPYTPNTANSFVVYSDVISDIDPANTVISVDGYGLSSVSGNLNTTIHYCFSEIQYFNIGEIIAVEVERVSVPLYEAPTLKARPAKILITNTGYTLVNTNLFIDTFGSLGKTYIDEVGLNYELGDEVVFSPKPMCFGIGAEAEVSEIGPSGQVLNVDFVPAKITGTANVNISTSNVYVIGTSTLFETELRVGDKIMINRETRFVSDISSNTTLNVTTGFTESFQNKPVRSYKKYAIGGQGYSQDKLPDVTISSVAGTNAVIRVISVMGKGDNIQANVTPLNGRKVGAIEQFQVLDAGEGLVTKPTIDMTNYGSGNAKVEAVLYSTYETYDGKWISTDSHISTSDRKIQGLNYYINHSYVISSPIDYGKYKKIVKDLVHPAGYIGYAEYQVKNEIQTSNAEIESNITFGESQFVPSIPFGVGVDVASVLTNNVAQEFAVNTENLLINQLPGFNNVTFNISSTSVFTNDLQNVSFNVTMANASLITIVTDKEFSINIPSIPTAIYNTEDLNFGVLANVVITSAELSNPFVFNQLIGSLNANNSTLYFNMSSVNTAVWPITFNL